MAARSTGSCRRDVAWFAHATHVKHVAAIYELVPTAATKHGWPFCSSRKWSRLGRGWGWPVWASANVSRKIYPRAVIIHSAADLNLTSRAFPNADRQAARQIHNVSFMPKPATSCAHRQTNVAGARWQTRPGLNARRPLHWHVWHGNKQRSPTRHGPWRGGQSPRCVAFPAPCGVDGIV